MNQHASAVLLSCLGSKSDIDKVEPLKTVTPEVWQAVAAQASLHRVAPLLYRRTEELGLALPNELAAELRQAYRWNARRNMVLYQELGKVLGVLRARDIPAIALKGLHLAADVYDSVGLRTILDIDLLVQADDLMRIERELFSLGCKPYDYHRVIDRDNYHFLYTLPESQLSVEIHWTIVPASCPFTIDVEGLWARAGAVMLGNMSIPALAPEDVLLHLCMHAAKDWYQAILRMLCDINEVVRRYRTEIDWNVVCTRAREWGVLRSVYLMLRLARELLDTAVPADCLASLKPASFDERYFTLAREQLLVRPNGMEDALLASPFVAQLWGTKGFGSKVVVLHDRLLLSRKRMSRLYPVPMNSLLIYIYYLVRVRDLLARYGADMWRLATGDANIRSRAIDTGQAAMLRDWLLSM